jgi:hypothetical protein
MFPPGPATVKPRAAKTAQERRESPRVSRNASVESIHWSFARSAMCTSCKGDRSHGSGVLWPRKPLLRCGSSRKALRVECGLSPQ